MTKSPPFPLSLGSNPSKVVDEGSRSKISSTWQSSIHLAPTGLFRLISRVGRKERGHGFLQKWDSHYTPLVETHDPDQDPQEGGLLVAHYGKGGVRL